MTDNPTEAATSRVILKNDAETYWQPVPANGYVRCILNRKTIASKQNYSMGTQTVAPGCFVREHAHDIHEEIIHFVEGSGLVSLEGKETPIEKGDTVFLAPGSKHSFINTGSEPLTFLWLLAPGGAEDFFSAIGRPRNPDEPAPEPFARPENIQEIERNTMFGWAASSGDWTEKSEG